MEVKEIKEKRVCKECRYWNYLIEWHQHGECRRKSPVYEKSENECKQQRKWPVLMYYEWCGEFKERK